MNKMAVVGQKKQARRILVKSAHTLQSPLKKRLRKQGEHTGMVLRLMGTFITGRLVQHEIKFFPVFPGLIIDLEDQLVRFKPHVRSIADISSDFDPTVKNQTFAELAAAKSLALQYLFQCHVHAGIVKEFGAFNLKNDFVSLYRLQAIKNPTDVGFPGLIQ